MEEVGEGEGGAEQGLRKFGRHLELVKVVKKIKVVRVVKVVKVAKTFKENEPGSSMRE